jgi:hypothetical protein
MQFMHPIIHFRLNLIFYYIYCVTESCLSGAIHAGCIQDGAGTFVAFVAFVAVSFNSALRLRYLLAVPGSIYAGVYIGTVPQCRLLYQLGAWHHLCSLYTPLYIIPLLILTAVPGGLSSKLVNQCRVASVLLVPEPITENSSILVRIVPVHHSPTHHLTVTKGRPRATTRSPQLHLAGPFATCATSHQQDRPLMALCHPGTNPRLYHDQSPESSP